MHVEKCPVCKGVGQVSAGFYSRGGDYEFWMVFATSPEQCRSCGGKGYLVVSDEEVKNEIQVVDNIFINRDVLSTCGKLLCLPQETGCPVGSHYGTSAFGTIRV